MGAARALFQERKSLSVDEIRDYLRNVAHVHLPASEVEEILGRLLTGDTGNLPAVALHQAFLFKQAARGFWRGHYSILVLERVYTLTEPAETGGSGRDIYLIFGIAGDEEAAEKLLGAASGPEAVLKHLQQYGLEIDGWFPLATEQWRSLLANTKDVKELIDRFGKALFSANGSPKSSFIGAC